MGQGISAVLAFAVAVAISPIPIIAVILMLFSARARVNGPAFLLGWVVALAAVSAVVYVWRTTVTRAGADGRQCWCFGHQ